MHLTEYWETYQNQVYRWYRLRTFYLSIQIWQKYPGSYASKSAWLDCFACSYYAYVVVSLALWASRFDQFITKGQSFLFLAQPTLTFHAGFSWMLVLVEQVFDHAAVGGAVPILPPSKLSKWQPLVYLFWLKLQSPASLVFSTFLFPQDQPFAKLTIIC